MRLVHFSKNKFVLNRRRVYDQSDLGPNLKPRGLWVSDESEDMSWSIWCRDNHFREENLKRQTELDVKLSEVLLIENKKDMKLFQLAYKKPAVKGIALTVFFSSTTGFLTIDWPKVAKDYKGILITPYLWEFRLRFDYIWYYGWDCAGGCIWDLSCIRH